MNGWVKLYRAMIEWEWFADVPTAHLWIYILLRANIEPKYYKGQLIPRGSFATTERNLEVATGLSRQQIRTALKKLITTNEITKVSTNEYTVISVVKYEDYQSSADERNQETYRNATNNLYNGATNPLLNKKKEDKNIPPFIPPTLGEVRAYCESRKSTVNPEAFYEYFSVGNWRDSKGKPVKNWKQKLITWENHRPTPSVSKEPDNTVPVYDDSKNVCLSDGELNEILEEMKRA